MFYGERNGDEGKGKFYGRGGTVMSVSVFTVMCNDFIYDAVLQHHKCLCGRIDKAAGAGVVFSGINPAGGSGGRFVLGGNHAD